MRGRETTLNNLSEKEIGYFVGLFLGDGYKYHDKKSRHYSVELFLNSKRDQDIIENLCELIEKIGANPLKYKDRRFNCIRIRINSKEFYKFMSNNVKILFDKEQTNDFKIGFISGFIDAEAHVNKNKRMIDVVNTDLRLMKLLLDYLQPLGLTPSLKKRIKSKKDKKDSYRMYIPVKFINGEHNSIKLRRWMEAPE